MKLDDLRVAVRAGEGLVARFPGALLVVHSPDWATNPFVERLIETCRGSGAEQPVTARLASLVASASSASAASASAAAGEAGGGAVPAFSALADSDDGLAVLVHGAAQVSIGGGSPGEGSTGGGSTGGGEPVVALTGQEGGSWGAHIRDRVSWLTMGTSDAGILTGTGAWFDLRHGVVPGCGVALAPRDAPLAAPAPAPPEAAA
ncbi:MAG: hypothetical protein ACYC1D_02180, partial [Acidimicrobiales bacterium]